MRTQTTDGRTLFVDPKPRPTTRKTGKRSFAAVKPRDSRMSIHLMSHRDIVQETDNECIARVNAAQDLLPLVWPGVIETMELPGDVTTRFTPAKQTKNGPSGGYFTLKGTADLNSEIIVTIVDDNSGL